MIDMYKILQFLTELEQNNNREWFHAHKEERAAATLEFENLIRELIVRIGEFDKSVLYLAPKDLTFKLVRDTRFGNDKSPYNPSFRAHISSQGKLPIPTGYFLSIRPQDKTFLGGGLFADVFTDATSMVREYISQHGQLWNQIIKEDAFSRNFTVMGTKLKNVPRGYDKEHPMAEFLKYKSWYLEYPVKDADLLNGNDFIDKAAHTFQLMQPFNNFLNTALKDFKMPERK